MSPITHQEVTPDILTLFNPNNPTMPRAFNVLEGTARGHIVVDNLTQPTWVVVRDATYGTLYFGGEINAPLVDTLVTHFLPLGDVGIGCQLDSALNQMLPPHPNYDGYTLYFTQRSPQVDLQPFIRQLPSGYSLMPRDERLFAQSFDYDSTLASFGTVGNVMRYTLGAVIVQGDTVLCEAATGAPTQGRIEIGVTTLESQRRRGFATMTCARLIKICESQGYATWWDCAKQNTPSVRLARKLGYQNEMEYHHVCWLKR